VRPRTASSAIPAVTLRPITVTPATPQAGCRRCTVHGGSARSKASARSATPRARNHKAMSRGGES
jgi:hypothetical protein